MEDPAPGFQRLRDYLDLVDCAEARAFPKGASFPLTEALLSGVRGALRLTKPQIFRVYHAVQLERLREDDAAALEAWTARVRKYLRHLHIEALSEAEDPHAALDEMFVEYSKALVPVVAKYKAARAKNVPKRSRFE